MRWCVAVCLLSVVAGEAVAQEQERLLILSGEDAWKEAENRLIAELGTLGIATTRIPTRATTTQARLDEMRAAVLAQDALGALTLSRVGPQASEIRVWLDDAVTGKVIMRTIPLPADDQAAEVALQAVELLRASLIEIRSIRKQRDKARQIAASAAIEKLVDETLGPPPIVVTAQPPWQERGGVRIGASGIGLVGGNLGVSLRSRWALGWGLSTHLDALGNVGTNTVSLGATEAQVSVARAGVGVGWQVWRLKDMSAHLGGTVGSLWLWNPPGSGGLQTRDVAQVATLEVEAGWAYDVTSWLRLGVQGHAGLLTPELRVEGPAGQTATRLLWGAGVTAEWVWRSR